MKSYIAEDIINCSEKICRDDDMVAQIKADMCDNYCRFPRDCETQDEVDKHCDECTFNIMKGFIF